MKQRDKEKPATETGLERREAKSPPLARCEAREGKPRAHSDDLDNNVVQLGDAVVALLRRL